MSGHAGSLPATLVLIEPGQGLAGLDVLLDCHLSRRL